MKRNHRFLSFTPLLFLGPDNGGGSGSASKPKTLAESHAALDSLRAELATAQASITSITAERDSARNDLASLKTQFDAATTAATEANTQRDTARAELATAQASITALTKERDDARADVTKANGTIQRLEKLCGVKGIDPKSAAPEITEEAEAGTTEERLANLQQRMAATKDPQEKHKLAQEARKLRWGNN
jgi:chromosome segregation ATPase